MNDKKSLFLKELRHLINKYSLENDSSTPDFILAKYLDNCLTAFNSALSSRSAWHKNTINPVLCDEPQTTAVKNENEIL